MMGATAREGAQDLELCNEMLPCGNQFKCGVCGKYDTKCPGVEPIGVFSLGEVGGAGLAAFGKQLPPLTQVGRFGRDVVHGLHNQGKTTSKGSAQSHLIGRLMVLSMGLD